MSWLRRLFGGGEEPEERQREVGRREFRAQPENLTDEQALERYRYLLRTAPPEAIEQAHAEAFAKLTPEQRALALRQLAEAVPDDERAAAARAQDDPQTLARLATRAELRRPGTIERAFGGGMGGVGGMGYGVGAGLLGGSLLGSLAAGFVGSAIAHQLFGGFDYSPDTAGNEVGQEEPLDTQAGDVDSGDFDSGGDFGGDFGGGDF